MIIIMGSTVNQVFLTFCIFPHNKIVSVMTVQVPAGYADVDTLIEEWFKEFKVNLKKKDIHSHPKET